MTESEQNEQNSTPREAESKPPARRRPKPWILVILIFAMLLGGLYYWETTRGWESTDDAQVAGHIHQISARVGGTVVKVNVRNNQRVQAGDILVELDPAEYQVAIDQAQADLAQAQADAAASRTNVPIVSTSSTTQLSGAEAAVNEAQANLATAERQVIAARAKLPAAEAMVRQARANHQRAERDLERFRALVEKEEISRQQFDAATSASEATQAQVDAAEAQLEEAKQAVAVAENQVAQFKARVARAQVDVNAAQTGPQQVAASHARVQSASAKIQTEQAALEQAQLDLKYTVIRAPVTGVISSKSVETGQTIQRGQALMAIVPLDDIWVTANFKENQLDEIQPGQPAQISVDAYGGRTYSGHVDSIAPATGATFSLLPPENATGNYVKVVQRVPVKIVFDKGQDPEHLLRPGMSVVPKVNVR